MKVGVRSDEGPAAIVERADLVVDGVRGLRRRARGAGVRFTDFLRTSVLLFAGAATALAVVAIAGAARRRRHRVRSRWPSAGGRWPRVGGLWLGRRMAPTPGIARLLAAARATNTLPRSSPAR